jgi:hypothetical protein
MSMELLFALVILAGIVLLGSAAATAGVDSRPGYSDDQSHHNSARGDF